MQLPFSLVSLLVRLVRLVLFALLRVLPLCSCVGWSISVSHHCVDRSRRRMHAQPSGQPSCRRLFGLFLARQARQARSACHCRGSWRRRRRLAELGNDSGRWYGVAAWALGRTHGLAQLAHAVVQRCTICRHLCVLQCLCAQFYWHKCATVVVHYLRTHGCCASPIVNVCQSAHVRLNVCGPGGSAGDGLASTVRVAVRVRPLMPHEQRKGAWSTLAVFDRKVRGRGNACTNEPSTGYARSQPF